MNLTLKISTAALTAAFAITLLASCAPQTPTTSADPKTAEVVETASPTPTPEPLIGDLDGDNYVSAWESEQLAKAVYAMPDGTTIPVPRDKPLPKEVLAAMAKELKPAAAKIVAGGTYGVPKTEPAFLAIIKSQSAKTSRVVITIMHGVTANGRAWVVSSPVHPQQFSTRAGAIAAAEKFTGGATNFAIVVID